MFLRKGWDIATCCLMGGRLSEGQYSGSLDGNFASHPARILSENREEVFAPRGPCSVWGRNL